MGRKGKCTKELCDKICANIVEGNTLKYSVQKEGITEASFYNWMKRGRESKTQSGKYFEFFESIKRAQEQGKSNLVKGIKAHGKNNWQAMAWLLERMHPSEYGRRENVKMEHSGKVKHSFSIDKTLLKKVHEHGNGDDK